MWHLKASVKRDLKIIKKSKVFDATRETILGGPNKYQKVTEALVSLNPLEDLFSDDVGKGEMETDQSFRAEIDSLVDIGALGALALEDNEDDSEEKVNEDESEKVLEIPAIGISGESSSGIQQTDWAYFYHNYMKNLMRLSIPSDLPIDCMLCASAEPWVNRSRRKHSPASRKKHLMSGDVHTAANFVQDLILRVIGKSCHSTVSI